MTATLRNLGSILIEKYNIDSEVLEKALEESRIKKIRLGESLVSQLGVSEEKIYQALAEQFKLPFLSIITDKVDRKILSSLPVELFNEGRAYPIYERENVIGLVMADPMDLDIVLDAQRVSGKLIEITLTTPSEMERVWEQLFVGDSFFREDVDKISEEYENQIQQDENQKTLTNAEILKRTESEPVVKMVNLIIREAINQGASDIHIEPSEHSAVVRFRINGMLAHFMNMSSWMCIPVTSRIKIQADLDIAEKRLPQDGRIAYEDNNLRYDLRVSTLPTQYGEKTVIRLLRHDKSLLDLKNIGLSEYDFNKINECIEKPQGMILVTGPTGSGKSTALFACLNQIRRKSINITTIENPIEYKLDGITQVQVNEKAGLTFAATLKSILRQDPDVILIGETRDPETAEIAMQAAQTGHLVLSTLHTNDAVAAVSRLKDLGIPPFLIGSSLLCVLGQRLVRTLCHKCKVKIPISERMQATWKAAFGKDDFPMYYYKPTGCSLCSKSGYTGRTGVFEVGIVNETIRGLIAQDIPEVQLRKAFKENGMRIMSENGIELVKNGTTSIEELLRVVSVERSGTIIEN